MGRSGKPGLRPRLRGASIPALLALVAGLALLAGCTHVRRAPEPKVVERGVASWYGPKFNGRATASGERYDMYAMTAAHKSLPFGTVLEIRNLDNGKTCRVRVNDRGPFVRGRIVDLSLAAAREIDMVGPGTARVELAVVSPGLPRPLPPLEPTTVLASAPSGSSGSTGSISSNGAIEPVAPMAPAEPVASTTPAEPGGAPRPLASPTAVPEPASAPAPARAPIRVEVSVPDAPAFTVQVGAFSERARAETLRDLLSGRFPDVAVRSDGTWHRVQVGSFEERSAANELRRKLERLGWVALVVALR